ncbi:endonuclease-reverse transcriptase [Elysia marginata]|uniref:Endonuclease-reverse transcriptase n=1 Tax=Elysia marginata TaxID=1093978 RepID=A0AAV4FWD8_9GAST|nr:endonuclease-reverse transcriptase [Elysia marginata]
MANSLKEVLVSTAEEVLGRKRRTIQPWVTNEVMDLCDKRRELRKRKFGSNVAMENYQLANKAVRKKMKEAKEKWIDDQCVAIEQGMSSGESRQAFSTLKMLTKTLQPKVNLIEDKDGRLLTDDEDIMQRWSEYCSDLYNHELQPDLSILSATRDPPETDDSPPIQKSEVEAAVKSLKLGKAPGVDKIPSELLEAGGEEVNNILTALCQRIWNEKKWPTEWTKSLVVPLPKKGNLRLCNNYRTISLISHLSKVMLRVILNRLKPKAEEILAEEAGFRACRSTVEQIFNCRILIEKHMQHQRDLFHNFIDFKKAFDRVWHNGLWHVLRGFNIDEGLVKTIESLYMNSNPAVFLKNTIGNSFKTTVGVRQGCLLSPVLFNIFLERIMQDTLHQHSPTISIGGRPVCNLRFADDIDLIAGSQAELQVLTDRLVASSKAFGMEVSSEKSKVMVSSERVNDACTTMDDEPLELVHKFKYLGATLHEDGSSNVEFRTRIALATAAFAKLGKIWKSSISFKAKHKLFRSLLSSILTYGCETRTLLADTERRIQAFENKYLRKLLPISYKDHVTNESVRELVVAYVGPQEPLLATVKRRKLAWFGHVTRHDSLSKTILQGTVEGKRRRGRQKKAWCDSIKEWTGMAMYELVRSASDRDAWRQKTYSSNLRSPRGPHRSRD